MTEPDPVSEVEGTMVANGSGPPPEDKVAVTDFQKDKGKNGEAEKENEELAEVEGEKHREENGSKKVKDEDESKQEKIVKNVSSVDLEDDGAGESEDVKMMDAENAKLVDADDERAEDAKKDHAEDAKGEFAEDDKMADAEDDMVENAKVDKGEDAKGEDAVDTKGEDGENAEAKDAESTEGEDGEDVKAVVSEHAKALDAEDVKMVDVGNVKDEEKGDNEVGEEGRATQEEVNDLKQNEDIKSEEEKVDEEEAEKPKKKRSRGQKTGKKPDGKEKKIVEKKTKDLTSTPTSTDRPVRERKTVERLVEVIEKEPSREFQVEKGRGTPLKDIPNVAYKLARKKPADIKLIHQTLFGRKGKVVNFKSHILEFSGFVWHESDEKQRAKMKEKLDKYVKDTLLDLCDLFDLPVSRANSRKEDLVTKLLDFLVAPHATTDVLLSEKDQSGKSRKHKRMAKGSVSKSPGSSPIKVSGKKRTKTEGTPTGKGKGTLESEDEDKEDDDDIGFSDEENVPKHSGSEEKESDSEEVPDDKDDEEEMEKGKSNKKSVSREARSAGKGNLKVGTSSKKSPVVTAKIPIKTSPSSKLSKTEDNVGAKVFSRKRKAVDSPKKRSTPKSDSKEKDTGKKASRSKAKSVEVEHPSKEELRSKICEILKEVDFNTATFTDILKQLAFHFKMDLTPRKASLKLMIQEELTKLAEEAEENEDDEDEEDECKDVETAGKVEV